MTDTSTFIDEITKKLHAETEALHAGDQGPRVALWSRHDPVTLFGAWFTARGWAEIEPVFAHLAARFSGTGGLDLEIVAADADDRIGYVVAIERDTTVIDGIPSTYALRVTTVLRREDGDWKVVHRHGDPLDAASAPPPRDPDQRSAAVAS